LRRKFLLILFSFTAKLLSKNTLTKGALMNKEKLIRFIVMYIIVLAILLAVQYFFLDQVNVLNSLFMPAVVAFLSLAVRSNVKKDA